MLLNTAERLFGSQSMHEVSLRYAGTAAYLTMGLGRGV
jgi:hypothetical protein